MFLEVLVYGSYLDKYRETPQGHVITAHASGAGPFIPPRPCQRSSQTGRDWCRYSGCRRLVGKPHLTLQRITPSTS
jgi:hypothetical protein